MQDYNLTQSQTLRQEQVLAPAQIQSLELLMAPLMELQAKLSHELAVNPVLEQEDAKDTDNTEEEPFSNTETGTEEAEDLKDDEFAELIDLTESWHDSLPVSSNSTYKADEEKHQHFLNSIVDAPTIENMLLSQLSFIKINEENKPLVELIIGSIDDQGYFRGALEDLAVIGGVDLKQMNKALKIVQGLDPPGIGARDLKESLLLQLKRNGLSKSPSAVLIKKYLDELALNHIPQIARQMKISIERLQDIISDIRKLNPYPLAGLSLSNSADSIFVLPEAVIEKIDGKYEVNLKAGYQPRLRISNHYLKLLENPDTPKETKEYIKLKVLQGNNIIKSLDQRQNTIQKIAEVIIDTQYDFFENGVESLKPLTMRQVADKIDLHETTVSRAVSEKYIQTPQGLFELKFFFTGGYQAESGDLLSSRSVMEKIKEIISEENPSKPYSDEAIAALLKKDGIPVARRTVAKYREEIGIPSSRLRRKYS
jgi:RNA polymerase sigma-54 factor